MSAAPSDTGHIGTPDIRPGTLPLDLDGRPVRLHGIGVQRVGDRWFAWGEDKSRGSTFTAVSCYSTTDFATWRDEGDALVAGEGDLAPDRIVERPKALQRPDGAWILFLHLDAPDYSDARVGYAIGNAPTGPFRYVHGERPAGNLSRDIGVYQEDGVGYLLSEDRDNGLQIYRLRDDYLGVADVVATVVQQTRPEIGYESPTLVRSDGLYYLFGSDLTGWNLNDNVYCTAARLDGEWSDWKPFAPPGSLTFESQVSVVVPAGRTHVYVGDRWTPDDLERSPLVILPLDLRDGAARLEWHDRWALTGHDQS